MLELKNITKHYKVKKCNDVVALDNINLKFEEHGLVFILGKSGSGKSTLLNVIGGLDTFDSGEIIIGDKSTRKFKQIDYDSYRNTYIGFVFQEYNMLDDLTVEENIALSLELQGRKNNHELVSKILEEVELKDYGKRKTNELSGGQKQRVAIARALIKDPKIIMADEPTGALDSTTGRQIMDMLQKLSSDKLVIVVSHDREFAELYADRIIELSDGKIISDTDDSVFQFNQTHYDIIRSKLPFINSMKMALGNLKTRPLRLAITILLSVISFTLFGLAAAFSSYNSGDAVIQSIKNGGTDYVALYYETQGTGKYSSYEEKLLSDKEASLVENNVDNIRFYRPYSEDFSSDFCSYSFNHGATYSEDAHTSSPVYYTSRMSGLLNISDTDVKSLGFTLTGKLPAKANEIAITKYQYEHFEAFGYVNSNSADQGPQKITSYKDIIDKTITFKINNTDTTFKVTGVIDTGLDEDRYGKYKSSEDSSDISEYLLYNEMTNVLDHSFHNLGYISQDLYNNLVSEVKPASSYTNSTNYSLVVSGVMQGDYDIYIYSEKDNDHVIYLDENKKELKDGEMIVSYDSLKDLMVKTEDGDRSILDIVVQQAGDNANVATLTSTCEEVLRKYSSQIENGTNGLDISGDYTNYELRTVTIKIAGVYIPDNEDFYTTTYTGRIILTGNDFSKYGLIQRGNYPFIVAAAPGDKNTISNLVEFCNDDGSDNTRYIMADAVSYNIDQADDFIEPASDLFIYVGLAFAVFAGAMLTNFITASIYNRKKQIGILKALGARSKDIFMIFCNESMVIALVNWALSSIVSVVVIFVVNHLISSKYGLNVTLISFGSIQLGLILIISAAVAFVASFVPVYKISRQKPIQAMR